MAARFGWIELLCSISLVVIISATAHGAVVSLNVSPETVTSDVWSQGELLEIVLQVSVSGQEGQGFSGADFKGSGRGISVDTNYVRIHDVLFVTTEVNTEALASALNGLGGYNMNEDIWWYDPFTDFTGSVDVSDGLLEAVVGAPVEAGFDLGLSGPVDYLHLVLEVQSALADPWQATEVSFSGQMVSYDLANQVDIFGTLSEPGQNTGSGSFTLNSNGFFGGGIMAVVIANWGDIAATREQGDLDGDGMVGGADYSMVLTRWGEGSGPEVVPAPASLMLVALGALAELFCRGRRIRP